MYEQPTQPMPPQPQVTWIPPREQPGPAPGVQFAPHTERLVAYIIDSLILTLLMFVMLGVLMFGVVFPALRSADASGAAVALPALLLMLLAMILVFGYFPFCWARGGQTLGMKMFGLYVVRDRDGGPIGWGQALLRLIGYAINGAAFYIGFAWILIDDRRRGWHDLLADTVVIKR